MNQVNISQYHIWLIKRKYLSCTTLYAYVGYAKLFILTGRFAMSKKENNHLLHEKHAHRLSENLKLLMEECDMDGTKLSKYTCIPSTTINRLRKEKTITNPTLSTLLPLSEFFSLNVSQLIGDEPLAESRIKGIYHAEPIKLHHIPLLSWQDAILWPASISTPQKFVQTEHHYSKQTFALLVESEDWENFTKDTILLVDPLCQAEHKDLVIVFKQGHVIPSLKQLLLDDETRYLKPLTSGYTTSAMTPEYKILGTVVEYKKRLKNSYQHPPKR